MSEKEVPGKSTAAHILEIFQAWQTLDAGEVESVTIDGQEFTDTDEVSDYVQEMPLSVTVRDGWREPGLTNEDGPEEYEILLSTGGPAIRVYGRMGRFSQPETATLQGQDWFTPWQNTETSDDEDEAIKWFAEQFYYGE